MVNSDKLRRRTAHSLAVILLGVVSGCAHNLFSDLRLEASPTPPVFQGVVLGVDAPKDSTQTYQLEKFVEALRQSALFKAVEYRNRHSSTDLILTSFSFYRTNPLRACLWGFEGQVLTIGTLGLFPQVCKSEVHISFALHPQWNERQRRTVSLSYQTRSIMGWAALLYLPFAEWTADPPNERSPDLVKAAFYREATEIQKLLTK